MFHSPLSLHSFDSRTRLFQMAHILRVRSLATFVVLTSVSARQDDSRLQLIGEVSEAL